MNLKVDNYELAIYKSVWDTNKFISKKFLIIGSNKMTQQSRALQPVLKSNINGTHELTFKMYYEYIDIETGELTKNEYCDYLINETKVRLTFTDKEENIDFVIKSAVKNSNDKSYTYTLSDSYINELSRNGFSVTLAPQLHNSVGTIQALASAALSDSPWSVDEEHSDNIYQSEREMLFKCTSIGFRYYRITKATNGVITVSSTPEAIPSGTTVYVFYSSMNRDTDFISFMVADGDNVDSDNLRVQTIQGYIIRDTDGWTYNSEWGIDVPISYVTLVGLDAFYGEKYTQSIVSEYNAAADRYLNYYNVGGTEYWGYEEDVYIQPPQLVNYIGNSSNFADLEGWTAVNPSQTYNLGLIDAVVNSADYEPVKLRVEPSTDVKNTGTSARKKDIKEIRKGEEFAIRLVKSSGSGGITRIALNAKGLSVPIGGTAVSMGSADTTLVTYFAADTYLTQEQLANTNIDLYLATSSTDGYTDIVSVELYRKYVADNTILFPDDTSHLEPYVYHKYYILLNPLTATNPKDCQWEELHSKPDYVYETSFAKRKTVEISKSNYYNIIQTLCEKFSCWAQFDAENKKVSFHNYAGKKNPIGFEYGVDLKSISRTLDSKEITTKLIVPQSVNQYAQNGFCTIARAAANNIGGEFIFNFDYYINNGMIDRNTFISHFNEIVQLKPKYTELTEKNSELNSMNLTMTKLNSIKQTLEITIESCQKELEDIKSAIYKTYGINYDNVKNDYSGKPWEKDVAAGCQVEVQILESQQELITINDSESGQIKKLQDKIDTYKAAVNSLNTDINNTLRDFNKLYFSFIQEGTWNDNNFIDDNQYYYNALGALWESAKPRVTYNIDVLAIDNIEGFEHKTFDLGDETTVNDGSFFGYSTVNGVTIPNKVKVIITELTQALDDPTQDKIVVQTYKNSFEDLFRSIGATVQQLNYNSGYYDKAASLANSSITNRMSFVQEAQNNEDNIIKNAGDNTNTWDDNGIVSMNNGSSNQRIRLYNGALQMSSNGIDWYNLVSPQQIDANTINFVKMLGDTVEINKDQIIITKYDPTIHDNSYEGTKIILSQDAIELITLRQTEPDLTWYEIGKCVFRPFTYGSDKIFSYYENGVEKAYAQWQSSQIKLHNFIIQ